MPEKCPATGPFQGPSVETTILMAADDSRTVRGGEQFIHGALDRFAQGLASRAVQSPAVHAVVPMAANEGHTAGGEEEVLYRAPDRFA